MSVCRHVDVGVTTVPALDMLLVLSPYLLPTLELPALSPVLKDRPFVHDDAVSRVHC